MGSDVDMYFGESSGSNYLQFTADANFGNGTDMSEYMTFVKNSETGYVTLRYNGLNIFQTTANGVNVTSTYNYYLNGSKYNLDESTAGQTKLEWDADDIYGVTRAAISAYVAANAGGSPGGTGNEIQYRYDATTFGAVSQWQNYSGHLWGAEDACIYFGDSKEFAIYHNYTYSTLNFSSKTSSLRLEIDDAYDQIGLVGTTGYWIATFHDDLITLEEQTEIKADLNIYNVSNLKASIDNTNGDLWTAGYVDADGPFTTDSYIHAASYIHTHSYVDVGVIAKPDAPAANECRIYFKSNTMYYQNSSGTEYQVSVEPPAAPPPVPYSAIEQLEFGVTTTEYAIEYNEDYTQSRKVKKTYSGGVLTKKVPQEWKKLNAIQKLLIK